MPRVVVTATFEVGEPDAGLPKEIVEQALATAIQTQQINAACVLSVDTKVLADLPPPLTDAIVVFTDGGCKTKAQAKKFGKAVGAWACVVQHPDGTVEEWFEVEFETTNNRMEIRAVLEALRRLPVGPLIHIRSDSEYVINGATQWLKKWIANGWKTYSGTGVLNRDLWEEMNELIEMHDVVFSHVKGHAGNPGNERADALCTKAMMEVVGK